MEEATTSSNSSEETSKEEANQQNSNDAAIAYQNKDITSKVLAESFKGKTFRVYGLDLPEISAVLPTNIPAIKVNELRLDNLFELADGSAALVDYESEYNKEDKIKYLNYLTGIANRYLQEKKHCPPLRMIVIYTGDIKRKQISAEYDIGAVKVTLEPAFLSELDSDRIFRHLNHKVEKGELLDEEELMEFIILPLSYRKKEEKEEKIRETVKLATQLQDRSQQLFALAGILAFTDKLIDQETANNIRRTIEMTKVARIFEEEKLQALARAEEEKRLALAKMEQEAQQALEQAKAEKQQALKQAKTEKQQALEQAKAEKQQALEQVKEEKQQALKQAKKEMKQAKKETQQALKQVKKEKKRTARECALKMLQKNYPSEEIVSIVPGLSKADIEAMRRKMKQGVPK